MKFLGVDLHKKTISLCVVAVVAGKRKVESRRRFDCQNTGAIRSFFEKQEAFQVVVEATANYEWFLLLVEDLADRCVLAHQGRELQRVRLPIGLDASRPPSTP